MAQDLIVKMILTAWDAEIKRTDALLNSLQDSDLDREIAPGKNTGVYLLGHLAAVHDKMLSLLSAKESSYPQLYDTYVAKPDDKKNTVPAMTLRQYWTDANAALAQYFATLSPDDWLQKHNAVNDEDFVKEPHRNKLNVLISRTNHLANHRGQLALLKATAAE